MNTHGIQTPAIVAANNNCTITYARTRAGILGATETVTLVKRRGTTWRVTTEHDLADFAIEDDGGVMEFIPANPAEFFANPNG